MVLSLTSLAPTAPGPCLPLSAACVPAPGAPRPLTQAERAAWVERLAAAAAQTTTRLDALAAKVDAELATLRATPAAPPPAAVAPAGPATGAGDLAAALAAESAARGALAARTEEALAALSERIVAVAQTASSATAAHDAAATTLERRLADAAAHEEAAREALAARLDECLNERLGAALDGRISKCLDERRPSERVDKCAYVSSEQAVRCPSAGAASEAHSGGEKREEGGGAMTRNIGNALDDVNLAALIEERLAVALPTAIERVLSERAPPASVVSDAKTEQLTPSLPAPTGSQQGASTAAAIPADVRERLAVLPERFVVLLDALARHLRRRRHVGQGSAGNAGGGDGNDGGCTLAHQPAPDALTELLAALNDEADEAAPKEEPEGKDRGGGDELTGAGADACQEGAGAVSHARENAASGIKQPAPAFAGVEGAATVADSDSPPTLTASAAGVSHVTSATPRDATPSAHAVRITPNINLQASLPIVREATAVSAALPLSPGLEAVVAARALSPVPLPCSPEGTATAAAPGTADDVNDVDGEAVGSSVATAAATTTVAALAESSPTHPGDTAAAPSSPALRSPFLQAPLLLDVSSSLSLSASPLPALSATALGRLATALPHGANASGEARAAAVVSDLARPGEAARSALPGATPDGAGTDEADAAAGDLELSADDSSGSAHTPRDAGMRCSPHSVHLPPPLPNTYGRVLSPAPASSPVPATAPSSDAAADTDDNDGAPPPGTVPSLVGPCSPYAMAGAGGALLALMDTLSPHLARTLATRAAAAVLIMSPPHGTPSGAGACSPSEAAGAPVTASTNGDSAESIPSIGDEGGVHAPVDDASPTCRSCSTLPPLDAVLCGEHPSDGAAEGSPAESPALGACDKPGTAGDKAGLTTTTTTSNADAVLPNPTTHVPGASDAATDPLEEAASGHAGTPTGGAEPRVRVGAPPSPDGRHATAVGTSPPLPPSSPSSPQELQAVTPEPARSGDEPVALHLSVSVGAAMNGTRGSSPASGVPSSSCGTSPATPTIVADVLSSSVLSASAVASTALVSMASERSPYAPAPLLAIAPPGAVMLAVGYIPSAASSARSGDGEKLRLGSSGATTSLSYPAFPATSAAAASTTNNSLADTAAVGASLSPASVSPALSAHSRPHSPLLGTPGAATLSAPAATARATADTDAAAIASFPSSASMPVAGRGATARSMFALYAELAPRTPPYDATCSPRDGSAGGSPTSGPAAPPPPPPPLDAAQHLSSVLTAPLSPPFLPAPAGTAVTPTATTTTDVLCAPALGTAVVQPVITAVGSSTATAPTSPATAPLAAPQTPPLPPHSHSSPASPAAPAAAMAALSESPSPYAADFTPPSSPPCAFDGAVPLPRSTSPGGGATCTSPRTPPLSPPFLDSGTAAAASAATGAASEAPEVAATCGGMALTEACLTPTVDNDLASSPNNAGEAGASPGTGGAPSSSLCNVAAAPTVGSTAAGDADLSAVSPPQLAGGRRTGHGVASAGTGSGSPRSGASSPTATTVTLTTTASSLSPPSSAVALLGVVGSAASGGAAGTAAISALNATAGAGGSGGRVIPRQRSATMASSPSTWSLGSSVASASNVLNTATLIGPSSSAGSSTGSGAGTPLTISAALPLSPPLTAGAGTLAPLSASASSLPGVATASAARTRAAYYPSAVSAAAVATPRSPPLAEMAILGSGAPSPASSPLPALATSPSPPLPSPRPAPPASSLLFVEAVTAAAQPPIDTPRSPPNSAPTSSTPPTPTDRPLSPTADLADRSSCSPAATPPASPHLDSAAAPGLAAVPASSPSVGAASSPAGAPAGMPFPPNTASAAIVNAPVSTAAGQSADANAVGIARLQAPKLAAGPPEAAFIDAGLPSPSGAAGASQQMAVTEASTLAAVPSAPPAPIGGDRNNAVSDADTAPEVISAAKVEMATSVRPRSPSPAANADDLSETSSASGAHGESSPGATGVVGPPVVGPRALPASSGLSAGSSGESAVADLSAPAIHSSRLLAAESRSLSPPRSTIPTSPAPATSPTAGTVSTANTVSSIPAMAASNTNAAAAIAPGLPSSSLPTALPFEAELATVPDSAAPGPLDTPPVPPLRAHDAAGVRQPAPSNEDLSEGSPLPLPPSASTPHHTDSPSSALSSETHSPPATALATADTSDDAGSPLPLSAPSPAAPARVLGVVVAPSPTAATSPPTLAAASGYPLSAQLPSPAALNAAAAAEARAGLEEAEASAGSILPLLVATPFRASAVGGEADDGEGESGSFSMLASNPALAPAVRTATEISTVRAERAGTLAADVAGEDFDLSSASSPPSPCDRHHSPGSATASATACPAPAAEPTSPASPPPLPPGRSAPDTAATAGVSTFLNTSVTEWSRQPSTSPALLPTAPSPRAPPSPPCALPTATPALSTSQLSPLAVLGDLSLQAPPPALAGAPPATSPSCPAAGTPAGPSSTQLIAAGRVTSPASSLTVSPPDAALAADAGTPASQEGAPRGGPLGASEDDEGALGSPLSSPLVAEHQPLEGEDGIRPAVSPRQSPPAHGEGRYAEALATPPPGVAASANASPTSPAAGGAPAGVIPGGSLKPPGHSFVQGHPSPGPANPLLQLSPASLSALSDAAASPFADDDLPPATAAPAAGTTATGTSAHALSYPQQPTPPPATPPPALAIAAVSSATLSPVRYSPASSPDEPRTVLPRVAAPPSGSPGPSSPREPRPASPLPRQGPPAGSATSRALTDLPSTALPPSPAAPPRVPHPAADDAAQHAPPAGDDDDLDVPSPVLPPLGTPKARTHAADSPARAAGPASVPVAEAEDDGEFSTPLPSPFSKPDANATGAAAAADNISSAATARTPLATRDFDVDWSDVISPSPARHQRAVVGASASTSSAGTDQPLAASLAVAPPCTLPAHAMEGEDDDGEFAVLSPSPLPSPSAVPAPAPLGPPGPSAPGTTGNDPTATPTATAPVSRRAGTPPFELPAGLPAPAAGGVERSGSDRASAAGDSDSSASNDSIEALLGGPTLGNMARRLRRV